MESGAGFLMKKYNLHNAPEVSNAARRTESRTGERIPQDPENRIRNYLARFEEIATLADPRDQQNGLVALKEVLHKRFILKPEQIPESYFKLQERILRERGQGGDWDSIPEDRKKELYRQASDTLITDQESSLDKWIDYFASPEAPYPTWLKYYATRSILSMTSYDKDKKTFPRRSQGTTKPFPDLNREALSYVLDAIEKKYSKKDLDLTAFEEANRKQFQELLNGENFAKLYAWAIEKVTPTSVDRLRTTVGEWIMYQRHSDPGNLISSIQEYGTGWCTAGEFTARKQLEGGDFYIYYSLDGTGKPTIPRVAIRMEGNNIAEVRGIAEEQNLDPFIGEVVQTKLQEFPDGKKYEKRVENMRILTEIEKKLTQGQDLLREDLIFLYEINEGIDGFGWKRDPRISAIRARRDQKVDVPVIFGCPPNEVAWESDRVTQDTKVYIGPIFSGLFYTVRNLDQIYTSFPEGGISHTSLEVGGRTVAELDKLLEQSKQNGSNNSEPGDEIIKAEGFITMKSREMIDLVVLKLSDLGLNNRTGIEAINKTARTFGLEVCPPEVGPELYLSYINSGKLSFESEHIAMNPVTTPDGSLRIFWILKNNRRGGLRLYRDYGESGAGWGPDTRFVFRVPK